jgi:hypothetical protein
MYIHKRTQQKAFDPTNPWEIQEGYALAGYLRYLQNQGKISVYSHLPHEQYTNSRMVKKKNVYSGVRKGVPDYIIVIKDIIIFLELKRKSGGVVSTDQKQWLEALDNKTTVSVVCKGFDESKKYIDAILTRSDR